MPAAEVPSSGINSVVDNICRLPLDLFTETCQHVLIYLQGLASGIDSAFISHKFLQTGVGLNHEAQQEIIRFLLLTFRSAGQSNISADELVSKLEDGSQKWSKSSLQVLHRLWSEHGAAVHAQQELQTSLRIGQVVDVQWRLGMAVSSDVCRSLNSPYVTLLLKIAEPSGLMCQKSFEMSIPQFQNFHKQFKEMAALMETV